MAETISGVAANFEQAAVQKAVYDEAVRRSVLGEDEPFAHKVKGLMELQRGGAASYESPLDHLRQAADGHPVLAPTLGGLVVGILDKENPWSFAELPPRYKGDTSQELGLQAHFAVARRIDHTRLVYGSGYGGGGMNRDLGADTHLLDDLDVLVELSPEPLGTENLANRLITVKSRLAIGWTAIHTSIAEMNHLSSEQRDELHGAASMAGQAVTADMVRQGNLPDNRL